MTDQLDLFGSPPGEEGGAKERSPEASVSLDPIPEPDPRWRRLARLLPEGLYLGTSSWTFPGWEGLVYRRGYPSTKAFNRLSLEEYARFPLFGTVGIDRSYYAPLKEEELRSYAAQLPAGFRCASKVWSEITTHTFSDHPRFGDRRGRKNPAFLDPELFRAEVLPPLLRTFAEHLGPLIVELPPSHGRLRERELVQAIELFLRELGAALPKGSGFAFELRDPPLLGSRYFDCLRAHGATHVFNYWSGMPTIGRQLLMRGSLIGPTVVARLMRPPKAGYEELKGLYAPFDRLVAPQSLMRKDALDLIDRALAEGMEVMVLVSNKAEGSAPRTVAALAELVTTPIDAREY